MHEKPIERADEPNERSEANEQSERAYRTRRTNERTTTGRTNERKTDRSKEIQRMHQKAAQARFALKLF